MFEEQSQSSVAGAWRARRRKAGEDVEGLGLGGLCPAGLVGCFTGFDLYPKSSKL